MAKQTLLSPAECELIREQYSHNTGIDPLAERLDVTRETLRYHLYGDCSHDVEPDPVTPPVQHQMDVDECELLRRQFAAGADIEDLKETLNTRWRSMVRHLTDSCTHDSEGPHVDRDELLTYEPISASACAALRERYFDADEQSMLDIARDARWSYHAVQRHINGKCRHELETQSRPIQQRSMDLSAEECMEIRRRWRRNPDISFEEIAAEVECSRTTVERHIKFNCSHTGEELLIDEMPVFDQWLDTRETPAFQLRDVLDVADEGDLDGEEISADAARPETVETRISRRIRNTAIVKDLKQAYEFECQVCGTHRFRSSTDRYAEGHHIRPLGAPHDGPDVPGNILVLCPDHHADFDYGVIDIDINSLRIRHAHDDDTDGKELTLHAEHNLDQSHLDYHRREISIIDR